MPKTRLAELYARRLGVIDEARIEFGPGFNVLTGETGAGKTLLLGALELCLGGEAAGSRYALSEETRAAAVFVRDDGTETVLTRESASSGRLRATLDGIPSSAEALRHVAAGVIVIHGQHDSLALRSRSEVLALLDLSGGVETAELTSVRREILSLRSQLDELGGDAASREREQDFVRFQLSELSDAMIVDERELERILEEMSRLSTLRDAQEQLWSVIEELDGDHDGAVLTQWARAVQRIPRDAGLEDLRSDLAAILEAARAQVRELTLRVQPEQFDPAHLDALDVRASQLQHLARKYGGTLASAISQRDQMSERLTFLSAAEDRRLAVERALEGLEAQHAALAAKAREARVVASDDLTHRLLDQLPRVALPHASLRFEVHGEDGSDVRILFAPNPGWPEGPLQALASGGELSRVLLALSLETAQDDVVAVFDEVDAGVGGQVAQQIGECLREVGRAQQVIAVTHLASVAAQAAHHFVIEKQVEHGVTSTRIRPVTGDERVREIARMLAGDSSSGEAHALARSLLESAS